MKLSSRMAPILASVLLGACEPIPDEDPGIEVVHLSEVIQEIRWSASRDIIYLRTLTSIYGVSLERGVEQREVWFVAFAVEPLSLGASDSEVYFTGHGDGSTIGECCPLFAVSGEPGEMSELRVITDDPYEWSGLSLRESVMPSPRGDVVYYSVGVSPDMVLWRYDVATGMSATTGITGKPLQVSPDGTQVLVCGPSCLRGDLDARSLTLYNETTGLSHELAAMEETLLLVTWQDGTPLALVHDEQRSRYAIRDLDSGTSRPIHGLPEHGDDWRGAFTQWRSGHLEILSYRERSFDGLDVFEWQMSDVTGDTARVRSVGVVHDRPPAGEASAWKGSLSPDGSALVYGHDRKLFWKQIP